jgi:agmatine deiminase
MITDFQTNKLYLSSILKTEKYLTFWTDLEKILNNYRIKPEFIDGTRDIWCRDYMTVQIDAINYVQFKYFPDYCIDHKNIKWLTIQEEMKYVEPHGINIKHVNLTVDCGNIVKSKNKAIMTEKVFKENKNRDKKSVINMLKNTLKVDEIFFIPVQPFDFTGHADGMVRFYDENTLLVNDYKKETDTWRKKLTNALKLTGLNIIEFPYAPSDEKVDSEYTAKGCYINFAQIGNLIIFPKFNINEDGNALRKIKELYPEPKYHIETIDSNLISKGGGVLNCLTWNVYKPITEDAIDYLFPVYGNENIMLVIHKDDKTPFNDTLCVQLYPKNGKIGCAWSIAKTIKRVEPIGEITGGEINKSIAVLKECYSSEQLSDILQLLLYPSKEVIDELVQIPQRLRNFKSNH